MPDSGSMSFERFGRTRHLRIRTAEDLARVPDLDEAHWVATGAPIQTINSDPTFLALVDTDHNGRVMCFEVIAAIRWLLANLRDTAGVSEGSTTLELAALSTDQDEAVTLRACDSPPCHPMWSPRTRASRCCLPSRARDAIPASLRTA